MPGQDERTPSDGDRPPASRVGDELQERLERETEIDPERAEEYEADALAAAKEKNWDQAQTAREGRSG